MGSDPSVGGMLVSGIAVILSIAFGILLFMLPFVVFSIRFHLVQLGKLMREIHVTIDLARHEAAGARKAAENATHALNRIERIQSSAHNITVEE